METKETEILAKLPVVRPILEQISNKWAILVLTFVCDKPQRFNVIKRRLDGITQKALTETLRRLERNGLIARRVIPVSPVAVEYSITKLGRTLQDPFAALYEWSVTHHSEIATAQSQFDASTTASNGGGNLEATSNSRRPKQKLRGVAR